MPDEDIHLTFLEHPRLRLFCCQQNNNISHRGFRSSLQRSTSDVRTERPSLAPWRKMFSGDNGKYTFVWCTSPSHLDLPSLPLFWIQKLHRCCQCAHERLRLQWGHWAWQGTPGGKKPVPCPSAAHFQCRAVSWQRPATSFCIIYHYDPCLLTHNNNNNITFIHLSWLERLLVFVHPATHTLLYLRWVYFQIQPVSTWVSCSNMPK